MYYYYIMKIAIDIDNTLLRCKSKIYNLISKLERASLFKSFGKVKLFQRDDHSIITTRYRPLLGRLSDVNCLEEIEGASGVINSLSEDGNEVFFLSSRPNIKFLNEVILEWLQNHKIKYNFVALNCGDKSKFCEKYGIDMLIDDGLKKIQGVNSRKIESIWFNPDGQKADTTKLKYPKLFHGAGSWEEIEKIAKEIAEEKKPAEKI